MVSSTLKFLKCGGGVGNQCRESQQQLAEGTNLIRLYKKDVVDCLNSRGLYPTLQFRVGTSDNKRP